MKFNDWFKKSLYKEPGRNIDHLILNQAAVLLEKPKSYQMIKMTSALCSLAIVLVITLKPNSKNNYPALSDSPELVMNYKDMELMADSKLLNESDWEQVK